MSTQKTRFVRIDEVVEATGLSPAIIRTLYKDGSIPCIKVGHRTILFELDKVLAAIIQNASPSNPVKVPKVTGAKRKK